MVKKYNNNKVKRNNAVANQKNKGSTIKMKKERKLEITAKSMMTKILNEYDFKQVHLYVDKLNKLTKNQIYQIPNKNKLFYKLGNVYKLIGNINFINNYLTQYFMSHKYKKNYNRKAGYYTTVKSRSLKSKNRNLNVKAEEEENNDSNQNEQMFEKVDFMTNIQAYDNLPNLQSEIHSINDNSIYEDTNITTNTKILRTNENIKIKLDKIKNWVQNLVNFAFGKIENYLFNGAELNDNFNNNMENERIENNE